MLITEKYEHWQLNPVMASILLETVHDEPSRHALQCVCVEDENFIATNGRKLVVIEQSNKIDNGIYFLTKDGFLLPCPEEGSFPKWRDVCLKDAQKQEINGVDTAEHILSKIVYFLNKADMLFDFTLLQDSLLPVLEFTDECVLETKLSGDPFQIRLKVSIRNRSAKILYIQMPMRD
jgi:hypothetical protein